MSSKVATAVVASSAASRTQTQQAWIDLIKPYAEAESKRTGIPVEVYIIQSGVETGWGTSYLWRVKHNPAGIGAFDSSHGGAYPDIATAMSTYSDRLMGIGEAGQEKFVSDVKAGASALQLLRDLQESPWAAGHYGGNGLEAAYAEVFGAESSYANPGMNTATGGGTDAQTTDWTDAIGAGVLKGLLGPIGPVLGLIPGSKGLTAVSSLAGLFVNVFLNWRYIAELFAGIALMGVGVLIVTKDVAGVNPKQIVGVIGAAA